jgi:cytosine/adenosine deaminase-related metal-dependent hydrolase
VILPSSSPSGSSPPPSHAITISDHKIISIKAASPPAPDKRSSPPTLLLPTLCHPHIHLDKPYLLTSHCCSPYKAASVDYSDLAPQTGTFPEALKFTSQAKARFTGPDIRLRGRQLLATAYTQGVTSARCFVEVDQAVGLMGVDAGLALKTEFEDRPVDRQLASSQSVDLIRVQLCAFAQDPVFSTEDGDENRKLMELALEKHAGRGIEVLGSTPYVETSREASERNVRWAITTALQHDLHLDFHIDYNLDESTDPEDLMVWYIIKQLITHSWPTTNKPSKTVVLGHATALTLLSPSHLTRLSSLIHQHNLPVSFVGLPTSDLYMMGRAAPEARTPLHRPRGTLSPIQLSHTYGLNVALGVNNVGNAFTPYGSGDPLQMASWGVGLYHAGTEKDAWTLYEAVSWGARRAIGLGGSGVGGGSGGGESREEDQWEVREGQGIGEFGLLSMRNEEYVGCPARLGMMVPARQRWGIRDVVWDVPETGLRRVIR